MLLNKFTTLLWVAVCGCLVTHAIGADSDSTLSDEAGFVPIFDGKSLDGWSAPDMRYWSVEDGAITARSSEAVPCHTNQFLVWQLGQLDDFELKLKFRIRGTKSANSGIQIRSRIHENGHAEGYQADIDRGGTYLGSLYDEHTGRGMLASRGQRTVINEEGDRNTTALEAKQAGINLDGWNDYHIIARGTHLTLKINGVVSADVVDDQPGHRDLWGKLALQIHSGPAMTVQFRDIQLKRLPLAGKRKKIVLIAGGRSHGSGEHEFNAGAKLLAKRLRGIDSVVVANYHDNGWPRDPTALDNANAIVVYADGLGSHPIREHFDEIDRLMRQGVGLMCMHYAVHVPVGSDGDLFKQWIGGFYESGFSSNPHWDAELRLNEEHPITQGATAGTINDEWYFSIRFADGMKNVTTLLEAEPSDKTRSRNGYPRVTYPHIVADSGKSETLMWAVERLDGGRGVGFTGGHWHRNWAHDLQRNVVLNAMLWVAGAEVPAGGIESAAVTEEELNANLDKKSKILHVELPKGVESE